MVDHKSALQRWAQACGEALPRYKTDKLGTFNGGPQFTAECMVNDQVFESKGKFSRKKVAEQAAACNALNRLAGHEEAEETYSNYTSFDESEARHDATRVAVAELYRGATRDAPTDQENVVEPTVPTTYAKILEEYAKEKGTPAPQYCRTRYYNSDDHGFSYLSRCTFDGADTHVNTSFSSKEEADENTAKCILVDRLGEKEVEQRMRSAGTLSSRDEGDSLYNEAFDKIDENSARICLQLLPTMMTDTECYAIFSDVFEDSYKRDIKKRVMLAVDALKKEE